MRSQQSARRIFQKLAPTPISTKLGYSGEDIADKAFFHTIAPIIARMKQQPATKKRKSPEELKQEEARKMVQQNAARKTILAAGAIPSTQARTWYNVGPFLEKTYRAAKEAAMDTDPKVTTLGELLSSQDSYLLTPGARDVIRKDLLLSVYVRRTTIPPEKPAVPPPEEPAVPPPEKPAAPRPKVPVLPLPEAPVVPGEFMTADEADPEYNHETRTGGIRPPICPRCLVSGKVDYYECLPTMLGRQPRLFCCENCLLKRLADRVMFSRLEMAMREPLSLVSRAYMTYMNGDTSCHGIPQDVINLCWECGKQRNEKNDEYEHFTRCLTTVDEVKKRRFCTECEAKYGISTDHCNMCRINPSDVVLHTFGVRVCTQCVARLFEQVGPQGRADFLKSCVESRKVCATHGVYNAQCCKKCASATLKGAAKKKAILKK